MCRGSELGSGAQQRGCQCLRHSWSGVFSTQIKQELWRRHLEDTCPQGWSQDREAFPSSMLPGAAPHELIHREMGIQGSEQAPASLGP